MSLVILTDSIGEVYEVHEAEIELPSRGTWIAHLETVAETSISGRVTITIQHGGELAATFVGTVVDGLPYEGRAPLVVVGGAGGLAARPSRGDYHVADPSPVQASQLALDIATGAGEAMSPLLDLTVYQLTAWAVSTQETYARALSRLSDRLGVEWRILADGTLWMGAETWPEAVLDALELDVDTDARIVRASYSVASARPGTTVDGRRITTVLVTAAGRAELHYEAST